MTKTYPSARAMEFKTNFAKTEEPDVEKLDKIIGIIVATADKGEDNFYISNDNITHKIKVLLESLGYYCEQDCSGVFISWNHKCVTPQEAFNKNRDCYSEKCPFAN